MNLFLYTFCNLLILLQSSLAADTIALNQAILDGHTLVSSGQSWGQSFELGFFAAGRSKNRYLGIWYKTSPDVIIWVANRNTPLTDSKGVFKVSNNGVPELLNSTNIVIWSANVSRVAASPALKLLNTGNLVLVDESSGKSRDYLWQSFDFPGDTRIPGMLMGENIVTGAELYLTSWRNVDDPSPGEFVYKIENQGLPMLVISKGTRKRFRTGPWNGVRFNGRPMFPNSLHENTYVFNKEFLVSMADPYNSSLITRLTLNQSGTIQRYVLNEKKWRFMYAVPNNECDNYAKCGPNGVCNTNTSPICRCLKGFTPKNEQDWKIYDWSGGCVRVDPPNCENGVNGDGFLNVSGIKLPDMLNFRLKMNMSLKECETECLTNCSCIAYTNPYVTDNMCLMWYEDLVDIREFAAEKNEQNVYVRVPISELTSGSTLKEKHRDKKEKYLKFILISIALGLVVLCLVFGCIVLRNRRTRICKKREDEDSELPLFDLATIVAATGSFSEENKIGEGGFGPVYKGILSTKQEVAVKRLSKDSGQGAEELQNEVILIAKLQHRNLVRLIGCCIQGDERMLIYEYMQNKSLDHFIFDPERSGLLTWPKRFDIIMGIARGLLYLHQDSRLKIIHRDLKTSNILLDSELEPKISDFGLARIFGGDESFVKTKRVIGTYGYMAPEYAIDGEFSEKSDIFSMGVLLLEIVSGKKNRSFSDTNHHHNLLGHAWLLWNESKALEVIDTCLKDSIVECEVKRCVQVGLLCVQNFAEDRPGMSYVLSMLGNEGVVLPRPKKPGFFMERSSGKSEIDSSRSEWTNAGETEEMITQLQPR